MKEGRVHLRLDIKLLATVRKVCKSRGVTLTYVMEAQLRKFLADVEKEAEVEQA